MPCLFCWGEVCSIHEVFFREGRGARVYDTPRHCWRHRLVYVLEGVEGREGGGELHFCFGSTVVLYL